MTDLPHTPSVLHTLSCRCVNVIDADSGVIRCVHKCRRHVAWLRAQRARYPGLAYYEMLGCIKEGVPQCAHYVWELEEALGPLPVADSGDFALEIGCGCSMYAPAILRAGFKYHGVEPDAAAAAWTRSAFDVSVTQGVYPDVEMVANGYGVNDIELIFCAHALEHMPDAPAAITQMYRELDHKGWLYLIVPDDSDQTNPDHQWFFSELTLRTVLEKAGFTQVRIVVRRRVEHENFLYCTARK